MRKGHQGNFTPEFQSSGTDDLRQMFLKFKLTVMNSVQEKVVVMELNVEPNLTPGSGTRVSFNALLRHSSTALESWNLGISVNLWLRLS